MYSDLYGYESGPLITTKQFSLAGSCEKPKSLVLSRWPLPLLISMRFAQVVSCDSPVGRLGLTTCYDLRFPELYQTLTHDHKAEVLLVPSAFTKITGAFCESTAL